MPEYEIRLHKADDTLSIIMFTFAFSDRDATAQARMMLQGNIVSAQICRCDDLIGTERATIGIELNVSELERLAREMRQSSRTACLPGYAEKMATAADELDQLARRRRE